MDPVPQNMLKPVFEKMLDKWIVDANMDGRTTTEGCLARLNAGYDHRALAAYVDDLKDPSFWLVVGASAGLILDKPTCIIYVIYGLESVARLRKMKEALKVAEAYAELHGCGDLIGASWEYLGAPSTRSTWEKLGFDEQETTFTKLL